MDGHANLSGLSDAVDEHDAVDHVLKAIWLLRTRRVVGWRDVMFPSAGVSGKWCGPFIGWKPVAHGGCAAEARRLSPQMDTDAHGWDVGLEKRERAEGQGEVSGRDREGQAARRAG